MLPATTTAASLVPSLDEVMDHQRFALPVEVFSVHVAPESVEVQMFPLSTTAASLVPSLDEVIDHQPFALPWRCSQSTWHPSLWRSRCFRWYR